MNESYNTITGVLVARFQVDALHDGHLSIIRGVSQRHRNVLIVLGVTPIGSTVRNPLDYESRKQMIQAAFPWVRVLPLQDMSSDKEWSDGLDAILDKETEGQAVLYGGRDSFFSYYSGKYSTQEVVTPTWDTPEMSGTYVRAEIAKATPRDSADFRAGVIYAMSRLHPQCKATVDIAIIHFKDSEIYDDQEPYLLLGRKPNESKFRFIGGFSEPTTSSYEADAIREVKEETGLGVTNVRYIGSSLVDDWRWKGEPDQIKTLLFLAESPTMGGKAADDIAEVKWFPLGSLNELYFMPLHIPIYKMLRQYWKDVHYD